jgi:hypothetical protein
MFIFNCTYLQDGSVSVRVGSHRVADTIVNRLGRKMNKYIRQMLHLWLLAFNDPYTNVVQTSRNLFERSFRIEKRQIAIELCLESTVTMCFELAINNSNLSIAEKYDVEENADLRTIRLISTSLRTLAMLMRDYFVEDRSQIIALFAKIYENRAFWALAKNKNVTVC